MNMKLQYEILSIGLKDSMMVLLNQSNTNLDALDTQLDYLSSSPYFKFSTYFVNDK